MNYLNLMEYINDHKSRTDTIHGWEVVKTKHGHEREHERHGGELPGGHHEFMHKVIKKISGVKNPRSGEFMYHSAKHNQAAVLNVDHEKKQLRVITVLPKGKSTPKPGTQKFMIEGVEQDIEVVILEDTEFDELFEEFVQEEFGVNLIDFLAEASILGSVISPKDRKEMLSESNHFDEFDNRYKDSAPEAFRSIKDGYLTHISSFKNVDLGASKLNQKHSTMSRHEFNQHVANHIFPHIRKAGYPKINSKEFHDAIYHGTKDAIERNKP